MFFNYALTPTPRFGGAPEDFLLHADSAHHKQAQGALEEAADTNGSTEYSAKVVDAEQADAKEGANEGGTAVGRDEGDKDREAPSRRREKEEDERMEVARTKQVLNTLA